MARSSLFSSLSRVRRIVHGSDVRGLPVAAALEAEQRARLSRRAFLGGVGAVGVAAAFGASTGARAGRRASGSIGIVGAGRAGLSAAWELSGTGLDVRLYEASDRVGGRQYSDALGPQTMERGGELIDTPHKQMLAWVNRLGLVVEDLGKQPGAVRYFFDGQSYDEGVVVDEYRAFVGAMRDDLRQLSSAPTALSCTDVDRAFDRMSLLQYLETRGAGRVVKNAIIEAYEAEYGLDVSEQSALCFLLFIHADKRSKFTPFGVFSDERFHVVGGNDQIAKGIHALLPRPAERGHRLVRVVDRGVAVDLTFDVSGRSVTRTHDRVVLAMPFSVLRDVEIVADLPQQKRDVIQTLGYGTNAKTMIGFRGPYWRALGNNGAAYSDLQNHQNSWESSPTTATTTHAILTDYGSAARGASLTDERLQTQVNAFLSDLDRVTPGARAAAIRDRAGNVESVLQAWPRLPLSRGSYTAYRTGQMTTLAGYESAPVGNLHFAGEHTNSFYAWQGYMEGALLSGQDVAAEILAEL